MSGLSNPRISVGISVSLADSQAGERAGYRALMQERVRGLLRFQRLDAALSEEQRRLVNRRQLSLREQGRLEGVTAARMALWGTR